MGSRRITGGNKVKLICSYGGKIHPGPQTNKLTYLGGDTKLLTVDRNIEFSDIVKKLNSLFNFKTDDIWIKYKLPGENLDCLISLIDCDDLENMMVEYDRLHKIASPHDKPVRIRLFISSSSVKNSLSSPKGYNLGSEVSLNPDYLFGFDKEYDYYATDKQGGKDTTKSAYDLELWKIPCTVEPARKIIPNCNLIPSCLDGNIEVQRGDCHHGPVAVRIAKQQQLAATAYRFPVMNINDYCGQQPIYNFVPTIRLVPEQMDTVAATGHRKAK